MNEDSLSRLYLKDTAFQNLMQRRIYNVLLIASPYDAFMMEEDGRVDEQLYLEYVSLNLSSPPRITRAANMAEALDILKSKSFDLIIAMPGNEISETFSGAKEAKKICPHTPFVVLTPFSKEVSRRISLEDLSAVDYVFSWLGNVDLLLAIIKLLEDKMNAENDIADVGVQLIMLVEDSVRFYSSVLPHLYKFILKQSKEFSTEALNGHEQMLRMRGRPKVMLARNYEEAMEIYERYGENMLGMISDVSFNHDGKKESLAGINLANEIHKRDPFLPIIIESSEESNEKLIDGFNGVFINKNSKKLPVDLGDAIMKNFGFGDFVIRNPKTGEEITRIKDLKGLQSKIFQIPSDALYNHARRNDISRWLYSRALFPIAEVIRQHRFDSVDDAPAARQLFFDLIVKYRRMKNRGVVAVFKRGRFDNYSNFARIGEGSLGGKGRGLAFIDSIIKKNPICDNLDGINIAIPRTVVLCTDIFDEFMELNNLYPIALSNAPDSEILEAFLKSRLPHRLVGDFLSLGDTFDRPLAVRSSSLLEDSHYQPFAGIYSTYMVPRVKDNKTMIRLLGNAIKSVYASVFYADSKAYMTATSNVIDQEKMAVIIQEVVGQKFDHYYFPSFSGTGRSLNYYPINDERTEEGVAEVAVGLGKYIVDGGLALRFSPRHPAKVLQTSTLDLALRDTQTSLYAIDMDSVDNDFKIDDSFNLARLRVNDIASTGALRLMASTYDFRDNIIRDTDFGDGRKVITFANMLTHNAFPLASAVDFMLTTGQKEMVRPVEIEFAGVVNANGGDSKGTIYWLQIRPIIDKKEFNANSAIDLSDPRIFIRSSKALGHGLTENINKIVYVRPQNFSSLKNSEIAREIEKINRNFTERNENYILIGPGRWGSSDVNLGIPVKWPHISASRLIVEMPFGNYRIEPSQGTHFFHNLTSFGVGYFAIDASAGDFCDIDRLDQMPAEYESPLIRIAVFDTPLSVIINGLKSVGVVINNNDNKNIS
ncbi:MAG: phosphoenolpyruvate synthase [Muribaculaceae bacterium]|nr:phosphoenolpyruvate synthase [Muribaculaceae bacterium]MBR5744873.1 phosphoenolpyruvate synthase [Muribaculaceae bacterium]